MAIYNIDYLNENLNIKDLKFIEKYKSTDQMIKDAEDKLNITFPEEYKKLCKKGAFTIAYNEFTCTHPDSGYFYVVDETNKARSMANYDISDYFVLCNERIDNWFHLMDSNGNVYKYTTYSDRPPKKVANSLKSYIASLPD